ncbi:MAG: hypothetical protein ACTSUE_25710 [Promethearchaeota archaeon]
MKRVIVVVDTNFFLAIKTVTTREGPRDFHIQFLEDLIQSFEENNITMIIPSRVLSEVEHFDMNYARFLELNFQIYPPVDTDSNSFYMNVRWINRSRNKRTRWFHVGEVTDLEVLTVANDLAGEHSDKERAVDEIWIVSNDEGIQKAAGYFLKDERGIKVLESATFLSYLLGVSNVEHLQDDIEMVTMKIFDYFTSYRSMEGREPISQIDTFFSQLLSAIRVARKDVQGYFQPEIREIFERFLLDGEAVPQELMDYGPALEKVKLLLELKEGEISSIENHANDLYHALGKLSRMLKEPADYTRFYNYISHYLIRIYLNAFKVNFINHDLPASGECINYTKLISQVLMNNPSMGGMQVSLIMIETVFLLITRGVSGTLIEQNINFLRGLIEDNRVPSFIPRDMINLLVTMTLLLKGEKITLVDEKNDICHFHDGHMTISLIYLKPLFYLMEDFCDEVASFGNHALALDIYSSLYEITGDLPDEKVRIEGKMYLTCLIVNKNAETMKGCWSGLFTDSKGSWEKTREPLEPEFIHEVFTSVANVPRPFQKRIKILNYHGQQDNDLLEFTCWIYAIKSKFTIRIPPQTLTNDPTLLKEIKILKGNIRVEPVELTETTETTRHPSRGVITIDDGASVISYYYHDKFFTLNLA